MSIDAEPGLQLAPASAALARDRHRRAAAAGSALRLFMKRVVEGLAVQQAGQRVALAVVEQALHVAVDAQHAADRAQLVGIEFAVGLDLEHTARRDFGEQREKADVRCARRGDLPLLGQARQPMRELGQQRQAFDLGPGRASASAPPPAGRPPAHAA